MADLVIRPSGVWDSRAPFHDYLRRQKALSREYNALFMAGLRVRREADAQSPERSVRTLLWARTQARRQWKRYKASVGGPPTFGDLSGDLKRGARGLTEYALIRSSALIELFAQCWALNILLTTLETGAVWTRVERRLARAFSPVHTDDLLPAFPRILDAMPFLTDGLKALPHIFSDGRKGTPIEKPLTPDLNALSVVRFWRAYRNQMMHSGGLISSKFVTRHGSLYEEMRRSFPHIPQLVVGNRFRPTPVMFAAVSTTHYRVALWMNEFLESLSDYRRGHAFAPGPKPEAVPDDAWPARSPRMLLQGDHAESWRWVVDETYRREVLLELAS